MSNPVEFNSLKEYIEVVQSAYEACIGVVEHDHKIPQMNVNIRLHYVQFDSDNVPKFKALASALVNHIIYYCIVTQKRRRPLSEYAATQLFREAKKMFRAHNSGGEVGELLLYFFLEAVLSAPQIICKMGLKTSPGDEVKGSDGIHIAWDEVEDCLKVYLGEAKLHADFSSAIRDTFKSIETFHSNDQKKTEISLVTTHFKLCDERLKQAVTDFLDELNPVNRKAKFIHACLVGSNWAEYKRLKDNPAAFAASFGAQYIAKGADFHRLLDTNFKDFKYKHLSYEFFFLPFENVQGFRDLFYEELSS